jgi:hypothetical protein
MSNEEIKDVIGKGEAKAIAREAYIFGLPLVETYRGMWFCAIDKRSPKYTGFNKFRHTRRLCTPQDTEVTVPNNDTLFSVASLDLRREPVVISVPKVMDLCGYMLWMVDMTTKNLPYISTVATGNNAGDYIIVGPGYTGYLPARRFDGVIVTRSYFVVVIGRTMVKGPDDVPNAARFQDGIRITALSEFLGTELPEEPAPIDFIPCDSGKIYGLGFFECLNMTLAWQPPMLSEMEMMQRFARIGVAPGKRFSTEGMPWEIVNAISAGMEDAKQEIETKFLSLNVNKVGEWIAPSDPLPFGRDYLKRAAIAQYAILPNSIDHAAYYHTSKLLTGRHRHRIRFEEGKLPPVNWFWSITLYDLKTSLLYSNPINRYSIGDCTEGIKYNKDGSLEIYIQHDSPDKDKESNWLPAPKGGFVISLRCYAPREEIIEGKWMPPAIERMD